MKSLQLSDNLISARNSNLARVALVLRVGDFAVVEDHSPATAVHTLAFPYQFLLFQRYSLPVTHTSSPRIVLREEGLGVTEKEDVVTLNTVDLAPSVHDPRVV